MLCVCLLLGYDVYVRPPLTEEKWKLELHGFIENNEFPCVGAWDSFHVLCISKLKQFYNLKKHYAMTNLELVGNNVFFNKIDCFNFLIENLLDERKHFIIRRYFQASVSRLAAKQFSSSTRRRPNSSSSYGVQFFPLLFFTFDIF